ncbi:hypothetical protein DFH08DRAFT_854604 [Mycena albidolilacea]|uniref:Uncharacterized protein n=1 Tax=Mycena albidolilacea TaxID=1033008 RepID=A0AAD7ACT6_9AGAR|nr:hypothetical protein DFH08DRAFT_854604 [Mycena albidolilacea]
MLAFPVLSLVVLVSLAVPTVSLTNTSIPHFHTIPLQPSTWQELATSHFYIPLILLASALGRFIGSSAQVVQPLFSLSICAVTRCAEWVVLLCVALGGTGVAGFLLVSRFLLAVPAAVLLLEADTVDMV